MIDDEYEFEIPEEIKPWIDSLSERERNIITGYILKNGKVAKADWLTAAKFFENADARRVDKTDISNEPNYPGGEMVSTVFLSIDHGWPMNDENHVPILFETMVFGGKYDQRIWRYATYGEAKMGHWCIVDCIRRGEPPHVDFGERPFIDVFFEAIDELRKENEDETSAGDEDEIPE